MGAQEATETVTEGEAPAEEQDSSRIVELQKQQPKVEEKKPEGKATENVANPEDFSLADLEPPPKEETAEEKEPEPEAGKKPLTEIERLQKRLEKTQEGSQKRINEVVAENKALKDRLDKLEAAPAKEPEKANGGNPLAKMEDDRLKRLLVAARAGHLTVPERFKDDPDLYHAEMGVAVEEEIQRRRDAKGQAGKGLEQQLMSAWEQSVNRASGRFPQMLKDGKLDRESVLWKATEKLMTEMETNPAYARHPDLPYLAAQEAYLRLSEGKQRREAAKSRRTEREVRELRDKTALETGGSGEGEAEESDTETGDAAETVADYMAERRRRQGF